MNPEEACLEGCSAGDAWEVPFYDAMRVEEVPVVVTVLFFLLYFLISNLILLNLFIAAILERLKITQATEAATVSEAARAALIMKEALEMEAAQKDLESANAFLAELKATDAAAEDIAEAAAMVTNLEEVTNASPHATVSPFRLRVPRASSCLPEDASTGGSERNRRIDGNG